MTVAITLWQPYATGIAIGAKYHETRPLPPHGPWRGAIGHRRMPGAPITPNDQVYIHAGSNTQVVKRMLARPDEPEHAVMLRRLREDGYLAGPGSRPLPSMAVVAVTKVTAVWPTLALWDAGADECVVIQPSGKVMVHQRIGGTLHAMRLYGSAWGDFTPGRWVWELGPIQALEQPVPCSGSQGVWRPQPELVQAVESATKVWL